MTPNSRSQMSQDCFLDPQRQVASAGWSWTSTIRSGGQSPQSWPRTAGQPPRWGNGKENVSMLVSIDIFYKNFLEFQFVLYPELSHMVACYCWSIWGHSNLVSERIEDLGRVCGKGHCGVSLLKSQSFESTWVPKCCSAHSWGQDSDVELPSG